MNTKKGKSIIRFDRNHYRLRTRETMRDNGTYIFRWTGGNHIRHTVYAPTLDKLREQEDEIAQNRHDGVREDIKSLTVNDLFTLWTQLKRGIKDSTFQNYIYMYQLFVQPGFGQYRMTRVKRTDVRRFYNSLVDERNLKISTVDGIHNVLHQVFQMAVEDDMIRINPTTNMLKELKSARSLETEKREALTIAQQQLFFTFLQTSSYRHWYPVFYIMANTGMRVGEITGLRWRDIDLEQGMISVTHTLVYYNHRDEKGCYYSINTPKTKAGEREIPMTQGVKEAFGLEKEQQQQSGMESISRIEGYDDFIFINKEGHVQNEGTLNKALKRIQRDCNLEILEKSCGSKKSVLLPNFSCHHLRHTFATRLCESGIPLRALQELLGYADIKTSLQVYCSVTEDYKKKEIKAYEEYLDCGVRKTITA